MPRTKNQKLRTLYIARYFLEYSDNNHAVNASDIIGHLKDDYGFVCERRSVYRDIAILRDEFGMDIQGVQGGKYKLLSRQFDFEDLMLLAQCVYATKFISKSKAEELVQTLGKFCSNYESDKLEAEVFLCDRAKAEENNILTTIDYINFAMATKDEGKPKTPTKITFKYMKYKINNLHSQVERRQGAVYKVSPYKLIINEGNYYLLAFDDRYQEMRTYRVDRMKDIKVIREPRDGAEAFSEIDLSTYTKRVFSMYGGENKHVSIRFISSLLGVVIERFGTGSDVFYRPDDAHHFIVTSDVEVSDQFYSWVCSFRKSATIISPPEVVEGMKKFLSDIESKY